MLSFSTEFPVPDGITIGDICGAVRDWITGSRYTRFTSEKLQGLGIAENWDAAEETEIIESIREDTDDTSTVAIVYRKDDEDFEWITTIVFASQPSSNWISVRVECEPRRPTAKVPLAKKPVLIKTLLEKFGGGIDGEFKMASAPVIFSSSEVDLAASCIEGGVNSYLPIVYLSSGFNGSYLVDPNDLAKSLFGMAHVVVEPSRAFSLELMRTVDGKNVYGGTIGLYWPEGGGRRCFFAQKGGAQAEDIERRIFEEIRQSLIHRRPLVRCTLAAVKELKSRRQINALKDIGSKAVEEYVAAFEEEKKSQSDALEAAEVEIKRLKAELRHAEGQTLGANGVVLELGGEHDFYDGEVIDIIRDALEAQLSRVTPDGRHQHVLYSLIKANAASAERAKIRERIKGALRGYQNMDARTKRELEQLGFSISEDGKHLKLVYQGDSRYTFPLPKSGSDHRGGLNAAGDLCRMLLS
jgi:hypothetical protein